MAKEAAKKTRGRPRGDGKVRIENKGKTAVYTTVGKVIPGGTSDPIDPKEADMMVEKFRDVSVK